MNRLPSLFNSNNNIFKDMDTLFDTLLPEVNYNRWNDYRTIPLDIVENEDSFVLNFDVGAADKDNISVELDKGYLTVSVNTEHYKEDDTSKYILKEISSTKRQRKIKLNNYMNFSQEPQASLNGGILKVSIPKTEQVKTKRIEIC